MQAFMNFSISLKVIDSDATYDWSKEEPEEEQLNSSLLARVAQRNMSIWRSHGMSEERPVYTQPEDETDDDSSDSVDTEVHEECYGNNNQNYKCHQCHQKKSPIIIFYDVPTVFDTFYRAYRAGLNFHYFNSLSFRFFA